MLLDFNEVLGKWEVKQDYYYTYKHRVTKVPVGFFSDGPSVPRILWSIYPPVGVYIESTVYHDFLIKEGAVSRSTADVMFFVHMIENGVPFVTACIFFIAVSMWTRLEALFLVGKNIVNGLIKNNKS